MLTPHWGFWPAAISHDHVSPTAREKPSTIEATIPESAAGKITRIVVWSFEAPRPKAPSRSDWGTADIESSEIDATGDDQEADDDPRREAVEDPDAVLAKDRTPISGVKNVSAK